MGTPSGLENSWSFRGGQDILKKKELLEELPIIAQAYEQFGGGNQSLAEREDLMGPIGWEQEVRAWFNAPNADYTRRGDFDAYKDGVLLEHESGEQMRANWHLMKMEAAYRDPSAFNPDRTIEAGVLLIPDDVNFPTLNRTKTDIYAVLANYFDFSLPLFVWEYPTVAINE